MYLEKKNKMKSYLIEYIRKLTIFIQWSKERIAVADEENFDESVVDIVRRMAINTYPDFENNGMFALFELWMLEDWKWTGGLSDSDISEFESDPAHSICEESKEVTGNLRDNFVTKRNKE
jgi:hypothetical protein